MTDTVRACLERLLPVGAPPLLVRFALFWLERRGRRPMPTFADLDPVDMPWALAHIFVIDRRQDGTPYYRLVGERMAARLGSNLVNKSACDVFEPGYAELLDHRWRHCLDEPAACYVASRHSRRDGLPLQARRILLPVGAGGRTASRLVGVTAFDGHNVAHGAIDGHGVEIEIRLTAISDLPHDA